MQSAPLLLCWCPDLATDAAVTMPHSARRGMTGDYHGDWADDITAHEQSHCSFQHCLMHILMRTDSGCQACVLSFKEYPHDCTLLPVGAA